MLNGSKQMKKIANVLFAQFCNPTHYNPNKDKLTFSWCYTFIRAKCSKDAKYSCCKRCTNSVQKHCILEVARNICFQLTLCIHYSR